MYAAPASSFEVTTEAFGTGLVGTLGVRIVDPPTSAVLTARQTTGIVEFPAGSGLYTATLTSPTPAGRYLVVFDESGVWDSVELDVTYSGVATPPVTPDLITLAQLKRALGDTTTARDALYAEVIVRSSQAIRDYVIRDLKTPADVVATTRRFVYDGSGILQIDDAVEVETVTIIRPNTADQVLTEDEYEPQPYRSNGTIPFYWLDVLATYRVSPEMGFTSNLDTLWRKYLPQTTEVFVDVEAKWGWNAIPESIVQAAIWTAVAFLENPRNVISEHVAGVGRTYANPSRAIAIPPRAQELLEPYARYR
jgi:hypothetical protein